MHLKRLLFLVALFVSQSIYGQLSKRHYFPPIPTAKYNNINSAVPSTPYLYLSTPETSPVDVTIHEIGGGTTSYTVSNGNPLTIAFNSNGYLSPFFLEANEQTTGDFGVPLNNKGLWLEADKEIYANLRVNSTNGAQAEMLTSKGSTGIGKTFYAGHLNNTYDYGDRLNFVSVMSLSNNNTVSISGLNPSSNVINLGTGNSSYSVTLQMHESLVFATTPYNSPNPTIDGAAFIGKLINSTEDIVVNVGSTNGNMGDVGNGRDYGFDQIVPIQMIGEEYVLVRGNGTTAHEKPIIIATENSTNLYFNDNPTPVTLLSPGNYYIADVQVNSANYFDENGVMALKSSKPVYVYQPVMADPGCCTQGMYFVPPLNCAAPNYIDEVTDISRIGTKNFIGSVNLISRKEATIDLHSNQTIMSFDQNGVTGQVPAGVNYSGPFFGTPDGGADYMVWKISGLTGSVKAFSDYDLYTGVFGYNSVAGWGGFYSGFGLVPEITATMEPINCIPSVLSASEGFAYYQWFLNEEVIPGANQMEYEATESGTYYVLAGILNCPPVISPNIDLSDPDFLVGGDDITTCPGSEVQLQASSSENSTTYTWVSAGDGYFSDPNILDPIYFPGVNDNETGEVILSVSGNNNGCFDEDQIVVNLIDAIPPDALCASVIVALDFYGMGSILPEEIDGGSTDNCLLASIWADPEDCVFNCDDVGDNLVELQVNDHAGNQSTCLALVTVVDLLPSVAICKDLVIELDALGFANVTAEDIDYGSFDNCAIYSVTIDESESNFTCDDLGLNFVDLDITDSSFNLTSCESEIEIVDLLSPVANCVDLLIYLDDTGTASISPNEINGNSTDNCGIAAYEFEDFDGAFDCTDAGLQYIGLQVFDQSGNVDLCISNIEVVDTLLAVLDTPDDMEISSDFFLENILPIIESNTCAELDVHFGSLDYTDNCSPLIDQDCVYTLDSCGIGLVTRVWSISGENGVPASLDTQFIEIYHEPDWSVYFPEDIEHDCEDGQSYDFGEPEIFTSGYEIIQVSHLDSINTGYSDACYSIVRTWTAINWCTYPNEEPIVHYQHAYFYDNEAPEIQVEDLTIDLPADACVVDVVLPNPYMDDCSDSLTLVIDHNLPANGAGPGTYFAQYEVSDPCGNASNVQIEISVYDNHSPVLVLEDELSRNINSAGFIEVLAKDFDQDSYDNCEELYFSFSSDPSDSIRIYNCDSLGVFDLEIWVWDQSGNEAMDEVVLYVEDGFDTCPDFYRLEGNIYTEEGDMVQSVEVGLNAEPFVYVTDNDGFYTFSVLEELDYEISPYLNSDITNGVTVYDLVLISQHILGLNLLDSPYKLIAADANNNQLVTTLDLIAIRKVILQMEVAFPNNTSWRFVDAQHIFPNPYAPWGFPETINFTFLETNHLDSDFIGVKVGDVNGSVQANGN